MTSLPRPTPLEAIGLRFETAIAEEHARCHPDDLEALRSVAYAYTAAGRLEEALVADLELVRRGPDRADLLYDLACSYALLGRKDEAFTALHRSIELGFDDREHVEEDPDLASLRTDPRWAEVKKRLP